MYRSKSDFPKHPEHMDTVKMFEKKGDPRMDKKGMVEDKKGGLEKKGMDKKDKK